METTSTTHVEGHPEFHRLLDKLRQTHVDKSAGYAGSDNPDPFANFRRCEVLGIPAFVGAWIRYTDKIVRITNIMRNPNDERLNETLADTLIDASSYALIVEILYNEDTEFNTMFLHKVRQLRLEMEEWQEKRESTRFNEALRRATTDTETVTIKDIIIGPLSSLEEAAH